MAIRAEDFAGPYRTPVERQAQVGSSDFAGPDYREPRGSMKRCDGRRVHPFSTEFFIQCDRNIGHEGWHRQRNRTWSDDSPWAIIDDECEQLVKSGGSVWKIRRAG